MRRTATASLMNSLPSRTLAAVSACWAWKTAPARSSGFRSNDWIPSKPSFERSATTRSTPHCLPPSRRSRSLPSWEQKFPCSRSRCPGVCSYTKLQAATFIDSAAANARCRPTFSPASFSSAARPASSASMNRWSPARCSPISRRRFGIASARRARAPNQPRVSSRSWAWRDATRRARAGRRSRGFFSRPQTLGGSSSTRSFRQWPIRARRPILRAASTCTSSMLQTSRGQSTFRWLTRCASSRVTCESQRRRAWGAATSRSSISPRCSRRS